MVAKISYGKNLFGVLQYNMQKIVNNNAQIICSNNVITNDPQTGKESMHLLLESFKTHLINNQRTKKPIMHISLNPHPKDKLTDEQLNEIALKYLHELGYGNQPYVIFKHSDIKREHIHIVTLRVNAQGSKINDSFEFKHSKQITRSLEKEYKLYPADKQSKIHTKKEKINYKDEDIKRQIGNIIKEVSETYFYQSLSEYKALLSLYNITLEEVKGEYNGKPFHGIQYFATNDKGEKKSNPFKASLFGDCVTIKGIESQIEQSKVAFKEYNKKQIKQIILEATRQPHSVKKFKSILAEAGVSVIFRTNTSNRLYGVTFIDHVNNCVMNGSRLGKNFSANWFENYFNPAIKLMPKDSSSNTPNLPSISIKGDLFMPSHPHEESFDNDIYSIYRRKKRKRRKRPE